MAASGNPKQRPLIIVKRKRGAEHEHHGGAWKVAYADFVTAMMAFFLVMWLVTSVSKDKRAAIYDYFKNPSMEQGHSTKPPPGQMGPGGASTSQVDLRGGLDSIAPAKRITVKSARMVPVLAALTRGGDDGNTSGSATSPQGDAAQRVLERKHLESLVDELRSALQTSQALEPFKDQLLLDISPDGIRIQIVDAKNRPMFDVGSARLQSYTVAILHELAPYLDSVPNRISLTGHTDTRPYPSNNGYTNWELSLDRANAARRALTASGLSEGKISRVVGLSSSVLFDKRDPENAINRRISIVVMTKEAEEAALKTDALPRSLPNASPGGS